MHDAILEDLVFPAEIVGKRIRVRLDGSRLMKVHLDKTQQTNIEHKVIELVISHLIYFHLEFLVSMNTSVLHLSVKPILVYYPARKVKHFLKINPLLKLFF